MSNVASAFDPAVHLCYKKPESVFTMKDLALEDEGISPIGVTAPFPLFTREGVTELRRNVLSPEVLDKYTVSSYISAFQGREFTKDVAPFVHAAWTSPEVIAAVSEAAGIDLVPVMEIELGHTNYQLGELGKDGVRLTSITPEPQQLGVAVSDLTHYQELADADNGEAEDNVVHFHYDSYPFVCVLMLSDVSTMIGGETALKCGDGSIKKARGPGVGHCVVMQGRHIKHAALRAYNAGERITMVTSFRARDPLIHDGSVLSTIHPITKKNRINYQWTLYRMKLLSDRFNAMASKLEEKKKLLGAEDDADGKGGSEIVNVEEMSKWIDQQLEYLTTTKEQYMP
ncbi:hypothetical protein BCR35DRAFT_349472 [Leucosporidium creatinivorum]|uniref:Fe2OG dioxygenase domain-containing protein n=1 Tax=Leucosporidium creatinivorum TaxID=106004 RepID=A0A1Y2G2S5_9BASI|nr:hypothetical protein BCR35DRAFT_349472 [Leucosporidium creatinivorum]